MIKTAIHRLGDLQLRIMKVLWARHEATVAEVHKGLGAASDLAYTTVATMLRKMEARRLVTHRLEERSFVYRAVVGWRTTCWTGCSRAAWPIWCGISSAAVRSAAPNCPSWRN